MYQVGDIVTVDLEPTRGSEQGAGNGGRFRPCLVVAATSIHCPTYYELYTIIPFTTKGARNCGSLTPEISTPTPKDSSSRSTVLIPQVRTVDPKRIRSKVNQLGSAEMGLVQQALLTYLNLAP